MSTITANLNCPSCLHANPPSLSTCTNCGAALNNRARLLRSIILRAVTASILSVGFSVFTIKLVEISINYKPIIKYEPPPPPPETPPEARGLCTYVPEATDGELKATFLIYPLSDEYRWKRGSDDTLENDLQTFPFSHDMRQLLNERARRVVVIGASSEEILGSLGGDALRGRLEEEKRAARRARQIAIWVQEVLHRPVPVRKLNIGHRDPEHWGKNLTADETADQRRVIIIIVLAEQEGIDFDKALLNALESCKGEEPIYETMLTKYSLLKDKRLHWIE